MPGFPIRTSSDPRSVGSSPRHIAASNVLHRLSMPRHPPCALKHLQITKTKKQKLQNKQENLLVRCSQPLSTKQTPHPTTKMERQHTHPHTGSDYRPVASGPNSVPSQSRPPEVQDPWRLMIKAVAVQKISAPPDTHYRRRQTYPNHHESHTLAGMGEKRCSLERR